MRTWPTGALLVQDEPRMDRKQERPIAYYVVPFGVRGENERGHPTVRVSVLVNAYTGEPCGGTADHTIVRLVIDGAICIASATPIQRSLIELHCMSRSWIARSKHRVGFTLLPALDWCLLYLSLMVSTPSMLPMRT